ncbi:multiheme c-type cytochrome [Chloroflexota bacterium]
MEANDMRNRFCIVLLSHVLIAMMLLIPAGCSSDATDILDVDKEAESPTVKNIIPLNILAPNYCTEPTNIADSKGLALASFSTRNFAGSGQCAECHQNLVDNSGSDVSISSDWRSTMMANAAKDPLWQAKVSSEIIRNPDLKAVIEGKCATCHMPMARTQALTSNAPVGIFDGAFLNPGDILHTAAMDGVSCTLCHQIQDESLGEHESFSGGYIIDTAVVSPNRLIYGPFPDPQQIQMSHRTGYIPIMGAQPKDSGLCATCHTLYTPYVNSQGEVTGKFPEQTPYLEWEASEYGDGTDNDKTCQDCHMPVADGPVVLSTMPRRLPTREPFAKHYFVGGNSFMLEILKANAGELNLTAATSHLDATIERTKSQLSDNTASISLVSAEKQGETLKLNVLVNNEAGHKLPTGFPSRRVWVHIIVRDTSGQIIFESGKPNPDGSISGNDADTDSAHFEPHYQVINSRDQVQIYETIMQDTDNHITYTLLRAASCVKDNRMLPKGFDKSNVNQDIAVYGNALKDDDFTGGEDKLTYVVPVSSEGPFEVALSILYQPAGYQFLNDLSVDDTAEIQRLSDFLDQGCKMPEVMSFAAYQIP